MPLDTVLPRYCQWLLQEKEALFAKVPLIKEYLTQRLGGSRLSIRIFENLVILLLGIQAFKDFGEAWGFKDKDFDSNRDFAIDCLIREFKSAQIMKRSRLAFDSLIEQLGIMAKTGRIKRGVHYEVSPPMKLYLHLSSCVAEFGRFARETNFQGEHTDINVYRKQVREIERNKEYILSHERVYTFRTQDGQTPTRCVEIDIFHAAREGMDVEGWGLEIPEDVLLFAQESELEIPHPQPAQDEEKDWDNAF
jgi:hypothetical protein